MTYNTLLANLKLWIEASAINGSYFWCEVLLEDEIELNPKTTFPASFICPVPFEMTSSSITKYIIRVYLVNNTSTSPNWSPTGGTLTNRFCVLSELTTYAEALVKALPYDWFESYPITFTPVVLWDANVDGIYFDLEISAGIICSNVVITNGTSGSSGIDGTSGTNGSSGTNGTSGLSDKFSTTSNTILDVPTSHPTTLYLTGATGLNWTVGQSAIIAYDIDNRFECDVVSYSNGAFEVISTWSTGTGTGLSPWLINMQAGTNGSSGSSGSSGTSGSSGSNGLNGSSGSSGISGTSGSNGLTGSDGSSGSSGTSGSNGLTGSDGSSGSSGTSGSNGLTGSDGSSGSSGSSGTSGSSGSNGLNGSSGSSGSSGVNGTGITYRGEWDPFESVQYYKNDVVRHTTGYEPSAGAFIAIQDNINKNPSSDPFASDYWAVLVWDGDDGTSGSNGLTGSDGSSGSSGTSGSNGLTGSDGSSGSSGSNGLTGSDGSSGSSGSNGLTGSDGSSGSNGSSGSSGTSGSNGLTGSDGSSGSSGSNGTLTGVSYSTNFYYSDPILYVPQVKTNTSKFTYQSAYSITVGTTELPTLAATIAWLAAGNMSGNTTLLLTADNEVITNTITINLPFNLAIKGGAYDQNTLSAGAGLTNKPMFILQTNTSFTNVIFDGSTLASYGTLSTENCFNLDTNGVYVEIKDFLVTGFYNGIYQTSNAEVWTMEGGYNNCYNAGYELNTNTSGATFRSTLNDWSADHTGYTYTGIKLTSGHTIYLSSQNDTSQLTAVDTFIAYSGSSITYTDIVIIGCIWNNLGTFRTGFDFTLKRDADIILLSNTGDEDMKPHAKINVAANTGTTAINQTTYVKVNYDTSSTYLKKFSFTDNNITYLPSHKKALMIWISGTLTTSTSQSNAFLAICKNGNTGTTYGNMNVFLDQNARAFNFSTNIYLDDFLENEYFSIYAKNTGTNDSIILQDMNMLILSQ